MFLRIEQSDGSVEYVNTDHINYMNGVGMILTSGKSLPLTPDGLNRIVEKIREASIIVRSVSMERKDKEKVK